MASVQAIALTAACLTAGMRDFCTWNSLGLQYDGPDVEHSLLVIWGAGCLELHAELVQYAPLVAPLADTLYDQLEQGFPGVWHYEVTEALGSAIAEWIALYDGLPPSFDWVKACLVRLAGAFMLRAQPQQWPAIRQILLTLPAIVLVSAMLAGCGSSAPSTSEAKQVAENFFGNCDNLKVVDFERLNGIPQNDGSYQVPVKYKVHFTPPDELKTYINETYSKQMASLLAMINASKQYDETMRALQEANPTATSDELKAAHPELAQLEQQTTMPDGPKSMPEIQAEASQMISRTIMAACPAVNEMAFHKLSASLTSVEQYANDFDVQFTGTYNMIKSDNGWIAS